MVDEREFAGGTVIFTAGEPGERVVRLLEGEVEVLRRTGGREVVIGTVDAGSVLGAVECLEGRRHSVSVRARGRVRVQFLDRPDFLAQAAADAACARELLLRLSERLREREAGRAQLLRALAEEARALPEPAPRVVVRPGSPALAAQLPRDGLAVDRFPFLVGRRPGRGDVVLRVADLALADQEPYRLSRHHFLLMRDADGVYVMDQWSALGTRVDGIYVGAVFPRMRVRLAPGDHEVVAGGPHSPHRFLVAVEER